ncbi:MAG: phosphoribosylamine--glycine ligase [Bacteriovorax sp.]|jgi:phosphoribosylamine--glycine ligase
MSSGNSVLVIGSGGREHAIAYKLSQSGLVNSVYVAPGNPGMMKSSSKIKTVNIKVTDPAGLLSFAMKEKIDFTFVGPEVALSLGVVDLFREQNLLIIGPTKAASMLESSKAFAKKIMMEANVPTAGYKEFKNSNEAISYIHSSPFEKMVVKCDGLAAGKGVIVCSTKNEAIHAVNAFMNDSLLGENIDHIIIEDFLEGIEVSAFALCNSNGDSHMFLGTACDHKRLRDGDHGPNTGGMGVFSPAPLFSDEDEAWINTHVFSPMLKTMKKNGTPFSGILFAGLMKTKSGWSVLEFNVRLGDPETQVLLPLIDEDLFPAFLSAAKGELEKYAAPKKKKLAGVHVVMAALGYPGTEGIKIRSGDKIVIDQQFSTLKNDYLFFAGVDIADDQLVTSGGRVLGVTALRENFTEARKSAYELVSSIHFEGAQYRTDIGVGQQ